MNPQWNFAKGLQLGNLCRAKTLLQKKLGKLNKYQVPEVAIFEKSAIFDLRRNQIWSYSWRSTRGCAQRLQFLQLSHAKARIFIEVWTSMYGADIFYMKIPSQSNIHPIQPQQYRDQTVFKKRNWPKYVLCYNRISRRYVIWPRYEFLQRQNYSTELWKRSPL